MVNQCILYSNKTQKILKYHFLFLYHNFTLYLNMSTNFALNIHNNQHYIHLFISLYFRIVNSYLGNRGFPFRWSFGLNFLSKSSSLKPLTWFIFFNLLLLAGHWPVTLVFRKKLQNTVELSRPLAYVLICIHP